MCFYAFLSDEFLFMWFPFDAIISIPIYNDSKMVVDYYSSLTYERLVFR